MMKILVGPINVPGQISVNYEHPHNPGIGGSEYHSIVLSTILSRSHDVTLWVKSGIVAVSGLEIVSEVDYSDHFDIQISYTSRASEETPRLYPLVAISHHPFDSQILDLPPRTLGVVNVGDYQLKSNANFAKRAGLSQFWLPVFLRAPEDGLTQKGSRRVLNVGHVSSLHPSKGFHDVLSAWMRYLSLGGEGTLEVLGGQSLYGLSESHPYLPVSSKYGSRLLSIMGGEVHETVKFLGRVPGDVADTISRWHLAVLNPKGFGESESVSMKDCWRQSVPVVAGNRFGQRDYMRLFPDLASSSPRKIAKILLGLSQDPLELERLQAQSRREYELLFERGVESGELWLDLVSRIGNRESLLTAGMPTSRVSRALWLQLKIERTQSLIQEFAPKLKALIGHRRSIK
jgi:hypothetical protein